MSVKACRCLNCGLFRSFHDERSDRCPAPHRGKWTPPKEYVEPKPAPVFDAFDLFYRGMRK